MSCPACGLEGELRLVEEHHDPIGGARYRLLECALCGVTSSEPRKAVGADWYERAAPLRGSERRSNPASDWRYAQFFADRVPPGRLLDVGCGDGGFMLLARDKGFVPTGFDYDERVVRAARERGLDAHAREFSEFVDSRVPGEFDVVTLFDVLEHTPEPAWFLGRLKALLKSGGLVALTMPNGKRPLPFGREEHDYPPHHFTRWTAATMRRFLEGSGFEVVRQECGTLRLGYLVDHAFYHWFMPPLLAAYKRLFFRSAPPGETISALYKGESGVLSDRRSRRRLVEAARGAFALLFLPIAALWREFYRLRSPETGDILYTLARKKP